MTGQRNLGGSESPLEETCSRDRAALLKESARVIAAFPGGAWVSVEPRLACHGCAAKRGCGSGLLARRQNKRSRRLAVQSETPLVAGQQIRIAIPAAYFLLSALTVYLIPLAGALVAGMLAETLLSPGHWGVPVAFLAGLAGGIVLFKCCAGRLNRRLRPQVIDP